MWKNLHQSQIFHFIIGGLLDNASSYSMKDQHQLVIGRGYIRVSNSGLQIFFGIDDCMLKVISDFHFCHHLHTDFKGLSMGWEVKTDMGSQPRHGLWGPM